MKKVAVAAGLMMLLLAQFSLVSEAATCNPGELSPCSNSFTSSAPPPPACCSKLKEQKPCLCSYIRNPAFAPYINSPNAKRVISVCKVPFPRCS
ncbi:hypothetical protein QQ045_008826 [Rhodiola kirilowii]